MNKTDCIYYDEEFNCCGFETDYGQPMPVFKPCHENLCKRRKPRPLLEIPKRTNYDKITESVESLANMIVQMSLNGDFVPCFYAPDGKEFVMDKERAIQYTIEWLQKECE